MYLELSYKNKISKGMIKLLDIMRTASWSEVFTDISSDSAVERVYRQLSKVYHPDNQSTGSEEAFKLLGKYRSEALAHTGKIQSKSVGFKSSDGKVRVFKYKADYEVGGAVVYYNDTEVAIAFDRSMKDLADRFEKIVKDGCVKLPEGDSKEAETFKVCLPKIKERLGGLFILEKTSDVINLGEFLDMVDAGELSWADRERHATWMMNRLYTIWCVVKYNHNVYMGLDEYNLFFSPVYHTVLPLLGWQFMVGEGDKLIGTTGNVASIMDSMTKSEKKAKAFIDGDAIKRIGERLFKGCSWQELDRFLDSASSSNPEEEWEKFTSIFMNKFGERKFLNMEVEYNTFYRRK